MFKIDCHTHILTPAIRDEYFSRTDGWALVMQLPESILPCPDVVPTVLSDKRLYLCPAIDLAVPIPPQLAAIEPHIDDWRVVGLKVYLSYQTGRGDDERLLPAYEFAAKHRLSVTFHTGLCSLILPSANDLEGSSARHIARAAERFPEVNFIAAHMDDPHFDECMDIVCRHENMFTDFSGAYETGTKEAADIDAAIALFAHAIQAQPEGARHILYGTDFCPPINLGQLAEYDYSIEKIFSPADFDAVYHENCLRAFPRLRDYMK